MAASRSSVNLSAIQRLFKVGGAVLIGALVSVGAAGADNYRGTNADYSTKVTVYNSAVHKVIGVRVGRTYTFVLEAFASDVTYAYMCLKVSAGGTWNCRDTIAAGTLEARIHDEFGVDFKITSRMVIDGKVTVRALDILKSPLVTRTLPVDRSTIAGPGLSKVGFTGSVGRNDDDVRSWVLRVVTPGENIDDFSICWKQTTGQRCTDTVDGLGTFITYIASPRVDYAIPMAAKNIVGGKFQAWLMFNGRRVASYSTGA
jgi:hypothetical protein